MSMTFYSVQIKESIDVPDDQVEVVTMKNGKKAARATVDHEGKTLKLFKFLPSDSAAASAAPANDAGAKTEAKAGAKKSGAKASAKK